MLRKTSGVLTEAVDEAITRFVIQLAESTAKGEAARYSHDEHGNRLPVTQHFLDLASLKTVVTRITSYLSWTHDQYVEREGQRREWEREQESW